MELLLLLISTLLIVQVKGGTSWTERIARRPDNILTDFSAYRHVSVVHFNVPENLVSVAFKLVYTYTLQNNTVIILINVIAMFFFQVHGKRSKDRWYRRL